MTPTALLCAGLLATALPSLPATAMDWTVVDISQFNHPASMPPTDPRFPRLDQAPRGIKVYIGQGRIDPGDADALLALYSGANGGDRALGRSGRDAFPEVWLDSPGGDAYEGFRIGQLIRQLRLATVVPEGAFCASACTMAFLGGVERRIEGPYLVHAAKPNENLTDINQILEQVQWFSAVYLDYARRMIDDDSVALAALDFGVGRPELQALELNDAQLRDWGIITVAARASQGYAPDTLQSVDCGSGTGGTVVSLVCTNLSLGRYDVRLSAALTALQGNPAAGQILAAAASLADGARRL